MKLLGKIYLSTSLQEKLGVPLENTIRVRAGMIIVSSRLIIRPSSPALRSFKLSPQLRQALYLKKNQAMQIRYDQAGGYLHIGPIIGIFSSAIPGRDQYHPTSLQAELICLSRIARRLPAQIYIFTPAGINWNTRTVRGYQYRYIDKEKGSWVSSLYPLPDVVYDRVSSRRAEGRSSVQACKKRLKSLANLHYFNPSFLNKWNVHQLLSKNPDLGDYLPETQALSLNNLQSMLSRYNSLYLKPANGSLGRGIIRVNKNHSGKLIYTIYQQGRSKGKADNAGELLKKTRQTRRGKAYIVQQGLELAQDKGVPFDVRIIYQKNDSGQWQVSKKFVRVAARGSMIANLSHGGKAETTRDIFTKVLKWGEQESQLRNQEINNLCLLTAETLERESSALYGELGLDIGIDREGKLWLIEVNSKPRKTTETELSMGVVRNTFRRPLQYAIFLAGFESRKGK